MVENRQAFGEERMKKKIKINFSDFWRGFDKNNNFFTDILSEWYDVEISDDPEYLFFSVFGDDFLEYDCIRIFFTGENIRPDFNLCDYAVAFDRMVFNDRYYRFPIYMLEKSWDKALHKHEIKDEDIWKKTKFCNFLYSNANAVTGRDRFMELLSQYKKVDSGGRYRNNIGESVTNKIKWQSDYKFTIAFENSITPGYVTEKLIDAYAAGTVPIYMGDPYILEDINPDSLIFCKSQEDFDEVLETVKRIDQDDELYKKMIQTPMLRNEEAYFDVCSRAGFSSFIKAIIEQPLSQARRRDYYMWTVGIENNRRFLRKLEKCKPFQLLLKIRKVLLK